MSGADEPAAAFDLIGHPDRLSIVQVLVTARRSDGDPVVRFTDLRDRSAIDDTGRFNYHLDKLRGTFVTETPEGYQLSSYAHRIVAPMMGGVYDPDRATEGIETDGICPECGAGLRIEPDGTVLQVVCEQGDVLNRGLLGYPGVLGDRPAGEAEQTLGLLSVQGVELAVAGTCPTCHGPVEGTIRPDDETGSYYFEAPCGTCGNQFAHTVGGCIVTHPAVVSFLHDHGVDIRRQTPWSLSFVHPGAERVESTEPLELSVDVAAGDETLTVTVDDSGSVVDTHWSDD